jgi:peptide/nickel transport system substrate-binding protein
MVDPQSIEFDQAKRWFERSNQAGGRCGPPDPLSQPFGTCWQPYVKGYTTMVNSIYNGLHIEDVWLDR